MKTRAIPVPEGRVVDALIKDKACLSIMLDAGEYKHATALITMIGDKRLVVHDGKRVHLQLFDQKLFDTVLPYIKANMQWRTY